VKQFTHWIVGRAITVLTLKEAPMLEPDDSNSENYRICWPATLAVFAVQMMVLITLSIAVAIMPVSRPLHRQTLKRTP
jgi:hypothetical protein